MKENPKRMKSDKYCLFHKDYGHNTKDCLHLKEEIKKLIQRGYLKEYVDRSNKPQEAQGLPGGGEGVKREATQNKPNQDNLPTTEVIPVISGGPIGGDSAKKRKTTLRASKNITHDPFRPELMMNEESQGKQEIVFGSQNLDANNDTVVISATIANFWVKKVLVDNSGSSTDIIFYKALSQMGINNARLTRVNTPLKSFSGNIVEPVGEVILLMSLGSYLRRVTKMVKVFCRKRSFRIEHHISKAKPKFLPSNSLNVPLEAEISNL
ncbi:UNVERIFIED_CONTAM: hypothetical protein Sradi_4131400 [Sesamum radiatum]|uniref:Gag-pol polyprotein n=1 Tax=Sesamum radiatum TaxID=300843 RepID=A0AAW2P1V3_SESRA